MISELKTKTVSSNIYRCYIR